MKIIDERIGNFDKPPVFQIYWLVVTDKGFAIIGGSKNIACILEGLNEETGWNPKS